MRTHRELRLQQWEPKWEEAREGRVGLHWEAGLGIDTGAKDPVGLSWWRTWPMNRGHSGTHMDPLLSRSQW